MSKRRNIIVALLLLGLVGIFILSPKLMVFWSGQTGTSNDGLKEFYIQNPLSVEELANKLEKEGVIDSKSDFMAVAEYKALTKERLACGKYAIEPGTSYRTLLNGFTMNAAGNGNAELEVEVTFNNCKTIYQMAGKVEDCISIDSSKLINLLLKGETLQKYGFTVEQIPAMFIPNTYKMYYDTDEDVFIARMASEFKSFWTPNRLGKLKKIGLKTPSQATTLASIVYAEQSINSSEWPLIAGLYLNRLNEGMRLQSDPTFKFCWGSELDGVQRLLAKHRNINCPYNTYLITGLPPGPINLPSSAVIEAVLNRADVNYLYMCAKPDYSGRHNFAYSGADHIKNAKIFQNWLAAELKRKGQ